MNSDPVPDQYYNPVTAILRGETSPLLPLSRRLIRNTLLVFFFFFILHRDVVLPLAPVWTTDDRAKETAKRALSATEIGTRKRGRVTPLFTIELSAERFVDRKDIAHVTGGAINSCYIPAIVGAFCPPLISSRSTPFFLLRSSGEGEEDPSKPSLLNPRALFIRWRLSVTN